jgi:hypothetical protein
MRLKNSSFLQLRDELAGLYQRPDTIIPMLRGGGLDIADIPGNNGSGRDMWDYALSYAEKNDKLVDVIKYAISDKGANSLLDKTLINIKNGGALIPVLPIDKVIVPVSEGSPTIFIIHNDASEDDKKIVKKLRNQLYPLQITGAAKLSSMNDLVAKNEKEVAAIIGKAKLVLLAITPDFIASDDDKCLKYAYTAYDLKRKLVPILLRSCLYNRISILEGIVPLPVNGRFVEDDQTRIDKLLTEIAYAIQKLLN